VAAEYQSQMETSAYIGFSTSNGQKLVHLTKPFLPDLGQMHWLFAKIGSPWKNDIVMSLAW